MVENGYSQKHYDYHKLRNTIGMWNVYYTYNFITLIILDGIILYRDVAEE